ncbi:acyltransferase [Xanthomonas albilineans]|uniref:Putative xanthomonadin biosynthesis acyltransferase protein n=1 Tax=Xanthomonas albilineans (strain GPE PC73 / CFBP 7063) TaxID=380358 RepID=D2U9E9_XANAP|nr:acyltransferase [Xanthomonas albilineans]PPU93895.1 acyltransferase [Xanthomonas albilineans]QHQ26940.1 putative xanthomonadin biosynthesis acyltransferase precursor protein [Xanthomonas albilineans]CBA14679.1 putative xanthomonadin biosynthesis acyltransferase precursor protein [Xanthomonas albilineans GPE PC73]
MSAVWKQRPEAGGRFALWLIRSIARYGGRTIGRLLLYPITLYFLLVRRPERRDSRRYLSRVFGRPATLLDVARHIHTFASTILDRVFMLCGHIHRFRIQIHGLDQLRVQMDRGRGVLIFGSHLGSFDALRVLATKRPDVQVKVVLDKAHNPALTDLLAALNPSLAANIIDAGMDSTAVVMAIKQAADEGALIALLVDRPQPEDPALPVDFLGEQARFPTSPWLIAAALKVPVMLAFGLYRGGNRYELVFETFSECLDLPRRQRAPALAALMRDYAARLEHYTRSAPYNWFNFYDFWNTPHADASHLVIDADTAVQRRTAIRRVA